MLANIIFRVGKSVSRKLRKELWNSRQALHLSDLLSATLTSHLTEFKMAIIGIKDWKTEVDKEYIALHVSEMDPEDPITHLDS